MLGGRCGRVATLSARGRKTHTADTTLRRLGYETAKGQRREGRVRRRRVRAHRPTQAWRRAPQAPAPPPRWPPPSVPQHHHHKRPGQGLTSQSLRQPVSLRRKQWSVLCGGCTKPGTDQEQSTVPLIKAAPGRGGVHTAHRRLGPRSGGRPVGRGPGRGWSAHDGSRSAALSRE